MNKLFFFLIQKMGGGVSLEMSHNFNFLSHSYDFLKISITVFRPFYNCSQNINSLSYNYNLTMNFYLFIYFFLNQSSFPLIFFPHQQKRASVVNDRVFTKETGKARPQRAAVR